MILIFNKYIKVNQNIKITAFEKKILFTTNYQRVRVGPDPALARPYRARVKPTRGQGQAEGGLALRVRVRASKNGLDPALGQCTFSLLVLWSLHWSI